MEMIEMLYRKIQQIDKVKFNIEIIDILNDLRIIDIVLCGGYVCVIENTVQVVKDGKQIYDEMYKKYAEKLETIGLGFYQKFKFGNGKSCVGSMSSLWQSLRALRVWLIEYTAFKILEHVGKDNLEEYTLNYYKENIRRDDELLSAMNEIDAKLMNGINEIE